MCDQLHVWILITEGFAQPFLLKALCSLPGLLWSLDWETGPGNADHLWRCEGCDYVEFTSTHSGFVRCPAQSSRSALRTVEAYDDTIQYGLL
jgi:hypothetical protein